MTVEEYKKSCDEFAGKIKSLVKELENHTKTIQPETDKLKELNGYFTEKHNQYLESKTQDNHIEELVAREKCFRQESKIKDIYLKCYSLKIKMARETIRNDLIYQSELENLIKELSQFCDDLTKSTEESISLIESFSITLETVKTDLEKRE